MIGFAFTAHPDHVREAQLSLFGPAALSPDRLAITLGRLAALAGAGGVGAPERLFRDAAEGSWYADGVYD